IHAARLAQPLLHKKIEADGPLVAAIRTSQSRNAVVRVVLEVKDVAAYSASLLNSPSRLVIDLYAADKPVQQTQTAHATTRNMTEPSSDGAPSSASAPANPAPVRSQPVTTAANTKAKTDSSDASAATGIPEPKRTLGSAKNSKKPDLVQPATVPQPTRDG